MMRRWVSMLLFMACLMAPLCLLAAPSSYDAEPVSRAELMQEMAVKEKRVTDFLRQQKMAAVLITQTRNFSWITAGLGNNDIDFDRESGPASLLLTPDGGKFVLASMNEIPRLTAEELLGLGYEARPYKWYEEQKRGLIKDIVGTQPVGTDVPFEGYQNVRLGPLRYSLTDSEVKKYRWIGRATAEAVEESCRALKAGMSEREIETLMAENLMRRGMRPTRLGVGVDERAMKFRETTPTLAKLKKFAVVNVCAKRWGLMVAVTRMVALGSVPPDLERKVRAAASINAHMQDMTRPGLHAGILFEKMVAAYSEVGFGSEWEVSPQGGAIGYDEHDWVLRTGLDENVQEAQAFAWSPSLEGVRMEDTIITFRKGVENLTQTASWPLIKTVVSGENYFSPNILVLGGPGATPTLPTARPTMPPPTVAPTAVRRPSASPTATPSVVPSVRPSSTPTAVPSARSSPDPSVRPSSTPTAAPSAPPSPVPSVRPSSTPTAAPSARPSPDPSVRPSSAPTAAPSARPSARASAVPTVAPSAPTASPRPRPTLSVAPPATRTPTPKASPTAGSGFD